jgi:hypothetical protein
MRKGFLIYEEMRKYSPYMRRPLVIYDFGTAPFWISLFMRKILFYFSSVQAKKNFPLNFEESFFARLTNV